MEEKNNPVVVTRSTSTTFSTKDLSLPPPSIPLLSQVFAHDPDEDTIHLDDLRFAKEPEHTMAFLDYFLRWIPFVIPFLAYELYDPTAKLFAVTLDVLAQNKWVAVDGGAYQAKIIAPAINGVVVPAISLLFANLIGTTISTLRQRQLDIRTAINMEAGQLRILQALMDAVPDPNAQRACRQYLTQYTSRLIAESQPTIHVESLDYALDTELNGFLSELNKMSVKRHQQPNHQPPLVSKQQVNGDEVLNGGGSENSRSAATSNSSLSSVSFQPSELVLGNAYSVCSKLYEERAKRITALRSLFPALHFIIVAALAVSICIAFLLETNQEMLIFLSAIQLRILWTMLVGTFSALAIVCYDLGNPFRGSYQISKSVEQLYTIRLAFRATLLETTRSSPPEK